MQTKSEKKSERREEKMRKREERNIIQSNLTPSRNYYYLHSYRTKVAKVTKVTTSSEQRKASRPTKTQTQKKKSTRDHQLLSNYLFPISHSYSHAHPHSQHLSRSKSKPSPLRVPHPPPLRIKLSTPSMCFLWRRRRWADIR